MKWFTDNQNVVRTVQVESIKPHLQKGAMSILQYAYSTVLNCGWNRYLGPRTNLQIMLVA